jgi:maltooligosyltrehalose trehalohydrolase
MRGMRGTMSRHEQGSGRRNVRHCIHYDEPDRYQNRGVLMYSRWSGSSFTLVVVNFTASDVTVPFWFPGPGPYTERLHGTNNVPADAPLTERALTIRSNYGQVWST